MRVLALRCGCPTFDLPETCEVFDLPAIPTRRDLAPLDDPIRTALPHDPTPSLDEIAAMPVPGAIHIPLGEVVERAGELDAGRETIVTCQGGIRSKKAIKALKAAGYTGALTNLDGGARAWYKSA